MQCKNGDGKIGDEVGFEGKIYKLESFTVYKNEQCANLRSKEDLITIPVNRVIVGIVRKDQQKKEEDKPTPVAAIPIPGAPVPKEESLHPGELKLPKDETVLPSEQGFIRGPNAEEMAAQKKEQEELQRKRDQELVEKVEKEKEQENKPAATRGMIGTGNV